jgi:hypothetical protein
VLVLDHLPPILGSAVDTWATVAVAIGTVGTVVYALFRDVFVTPRRRPRLDLRFDNEGSDQIVVGTADRLAAAHVRLRVANGQRKDTADDSGRRATDRTPVAVVRDQPSSHHVLRASRLPSSRRPPSRRLPARDESEIAGKWATSVPVQLDVTPKPPGGQDILHSGTYEVSAEVRARNADAVGYVIRVHWDGKWSGRAAIWDHLRVEPPRKVR